LLKRLIDIVGKRLRIDPSSSPIFAILAALVKLTSKGRYFFGSSVLANFRFHLLS